MKAFKIGMNEIIINLEELEHKLKSMDLFNELKIISERSLNCIDCLNDLKENEFRNSRCESCFNIWLNRRTPTYQKSRYEVLKK